jgi:Ni/Co efflux regulator RcnB
MKRILAAAVALSLIGGSAFAGDHGHGRGHGRDGDRWEDRDHDRWDGHDRGLHRGHYKKWRKGERIGGYRYVVVEPYRHHLRPAPRGYRWVRADGGDFLLAAIATGVIVDIVLNAD